MTTSSIKFIYATKHSLLGEAASKQILKQAVAFHQIYEENFLLIVKDSIKEVNHLLPKKVKILKKSKNNFLFFFQLLLTLRKCKSIDGIYTRDLIVVLSSILSLKKVVYEIHKPPSKIGKLFIKLTKNLFRFVSISNNLKKYLSEEFHVNDSSVIVQHDSVDFRHYSDFIPKRELFRKQLNFKNELTYVIYTGTVGKGRDMQNFFELIKFYKDINFIILGDDGSKFKSLLKIDNFPKNLSFKGYLKTSEVMKYQISADVLINLIDKTHPNVNYCSQLKIFEYFATKNLVVTPCIGSLSEIVSNKNSLIYNHDFGNGLLKIFKEIDSHLKNSKEIREHAFKFVEEFNWHNRAKKIIEFLN